jgi:hypothetical protein
MDVQAQAKAPTQTIITAQNAADGFQKQKCSFTAENTRGPTTPFLKLTLTRFARNAEED